MFGQSNDTWFACWNKDTTSFGYKDKNGAVKIKPKFEAYYDNCGNPKDWIYPTMEIVVSHKNNNDFSQSHYEFLQTENGNKLIRVSIENENLW